MFHAGGMRLLGKRLQEAGLLQDGLTASGRNLFDEIAEAKETPGQEVIRPLANPIKKDGGLAILRGSLAPEGCVVKLTGHERRISHRPGARVRFRGSGVRSRAAAANSSGRRGRDSVRRPEGRPRNAGNAGRHGRARRPGHQRIDRAAHRRPLQRSDARPDGRARSSGSGDTAARSRSFATAT